MTYRKALKELRNGNKVKRKNGNIYFVEIKDVHKKDGEHSIFVGYNEDGSFANIKSKKEFFSFLLSKFAWDWVVINDKT